MLSSCLLPITNYNEVYSSNGTLQNPKFNDDGSCYYHDLIFFGNYWHNDTNGDGIADELDKKEPIAWRVLSINGNDAFLLCNEILNFKSYNDEDISCTWETCTLRTWLNNEFYDTAFSENEKKAIKKSYVKNDNNPIYGTNGGNDTYDYIYLLSLSEAINPNYGLARYCYMNYNNTGKDVYLYNNLPTDTPDNGIFLYNNYPEATPFAKEKGHTVWGEIDYSNELFCFRTPGSNNQRVSGLCWNNVDREGTFVYKRYAIQPVLHINLSSTTWKNANTKPLDESYQEQQNSQTYNPSISKTKGNTEITVSASYTDSLFGKKTTKKALYSKEWFNKNASSLDNKTQGNLAKLSMLASATVYDKENKNNDKNLGISFMKKLGFNGVKYVDHKNTTSNFNHANYIVGYQNLSNYTLFAIWIRGSVGNLEKLTGDWRSNLFFGINTKKHYGFGKAEKELNKELAKYIKKLDKQGKIKSKRKFWITGHSRGAAIANLVGKDFTSKYKKANVFCYTFATPYVSTKGTNKKKKYNNIKNYINPGDAVAALPPKQMKYKRYGEDILLNNNYSKFKKLFKKETGVKFIGNHTKNSVNELFKTLKLNKKDINLGMLNCFKKIGKHEIKKISQAHSQTTYLLWLDAIYN